MVHFTNQKCTNFLTLNWLWNLFFVHVSECAAKALIIWDVLTLARPNCWVNFSLPVNRNAYKKWIAITYAGLIRLAELYNQGLKGGENRGGGRRICSKFFKTQISYTFISFTQKSNSKWHFPSIRDIKFMEVPLDGVSHSHPFFQQVCPCFTETSLLPSPPQKKNIVLSSLKLITCHLCPAEMKINTFTRRNNNLLLQ